MLIHGAYSYSEHLPKVQRSEEVDGYTRYVITMETIMEAVQKEMKYARETHREFASWHEFWSVVREEDQEFWDSVKRDQPHLDEIFQGIACRILAVMELGDTSGERKLADGV